ncbi:hypothetical protein [Fusobacterium polymorphum]|uniref:hypothetical protein n=1 Tax=Fusobacterium nucleatum subsp. polymorphum TaxID=76857 RepID=UPI002B4BD32C|nr:hypothetical protein [Fusobacterium polymorphum]WRL75764.1 hypothetical protein VKN80_02380 [Fusobacterium polymorphum]
MAKYTENIRLAQPEGSDYYDIEVFNHNSELIDKKIGEMDNSLSTIKEGATREKAGIVQLGTEEGKALEGMMLARLAGAYEYGGDIQDEGVKNPNYIYYDRNTRKMYKCLKQNQDISANVANFVPLDNNSLLERLENLYKIEYKTDYDVLTILNRKIVIGSLETKGATASKTLIANGFSFKNSIVMATAKKDNCSVAVIHSGDNLDFSTLDATSGNVQNGICKVDFFILLRN